jgi:uncharacterized spore protein YtfJ
MRMNLHSGWGGGTPSDQRPAGDAPPAGDALDPQAVLLIESNHGRLVDL